MQFGGNRIALAGGGLAAFTVVALLAKLNFASANRPKKVLEWD